MTRDYAALVKRGLSHSVQRLDPPAAYRDELHALLGYPLTNWTSPFDRGYQYEFHIEEGAFEVSLLVEISAIARVAAVYYGYRERKVDGSASDHCADVPDHAAHSQVRETVIAFLRNAGYDILPHASLSEKYHGKTLRELLIYDPED